MANRRFTKIKPGGKVTWEYVEKVEPERALTFWERIKKWFVELPIWSIK